MYVKPTVAKRLQEMQAHYQPNHEGTWTPPSHYTLHVEGEEKPHIILDPQGMEAFRELKDLDMEGQQFLLDAIHSRGYNTDIIPTLNPEEYCGIMHLPAGWLAAEAKLYIPANQAFTRSMVIRIMRTLVGLFSPEHWRNKPSYTIDHSQRVNPLLYKAQAQSFWTSLITYAEARATLINSLHSITGPKDPTAFAIRQAQAQEKDALLDLINHFTQVTGWVPLYRPGIMLNNNFATAWTLIPSLP